MHYVQGESFRWKIPDPAIGSEKLAIDLNMSRAASSILWNRGYKTREAAHTFLFYSYDEQKYHPRNLCDAQKAVDRIIAAIHAQEKILIAGDYDVDGMTSTSLMLTALLGCGANVNFFLPNRVHDGYGLSERTVQRAHKNGYSLIITVDNGTAAHAAIEAANRCAIDVIITDHHQPHDHLPPAYALVNPHQPACPYPFKELAGVGVAFKVVQLLYETLGLDLSEKMYELLLLGTVADVVPLLGENRHWVSNGLHSIRKNCSIPLEILSHNARLQSSRPLGSLDIGFSIAPQLNALGRLEDPRQAVKFLLSCNREEAATIGAHLHELNQTRRELETAAVEEIKKMIRTQGINPRADKCIVLAHTWPVGIVGLIAARITNYYGVPTCILHETEDGMLKGSCRSIPECNIFQCLQQVPSHLIVNFGGHAHAAGLTLEKKNLESFTKALADAVEAQCNAEDLQPHLHIDATVDLEEINTQLWRDLQLLEPYGAHNAFPIFNIPHVTIASPQLLKDRHIKVKITSERGTGTAIFFNRPELYPLFQEHQLRPCAIAGKLTENTWNNKTNIEIIASDICFL